MNKHQFFLVFSLFLTASPLAAIPYAGYLYPAGVSAGTTVRVLVGGQNLNGITGGVVSGKGVRIKRVVYVPGFPNPYAEQRRWLIKWLNGIRKGNKSKPPYPENMDEWRKCSWWEILDQLGELELMLVTKRLYVRPNPLQQTPSLRQMLIVDVEADADAAPGMRELRLYGYRGVSAPKLFFVDRTPHCQEPLYRAPGLPKAETPVVKAVPAVINGQIMPGEEDSFIVNLEKNTAYSFILTGRKFQPFIGDAVPGHFQPVLQIFDPDGKEVAFADDEYFDPDPVLRFKSSKAGNYLLKIRDNLFRGREDFVYRVELQKGTLPYRMHSRSFADFDQLPEKAAKGRRIYTGRRVVIDGVLEKKGERDSYLIQGRKGMKFHAAVAARRDGSPLDGVLELYGPDGKLAARADDAPQSINAGVILQQIDPELSTVFAADGIYKLTISDLNRTGGQDYRYRLLLGEPEPDFRVYTVRSICNIYPRSSGQIKVAVERTGGFNGTVKLYGDKKYVQDQQIKAGVSEYMLRIYNPERYPVPPRPLEIWAEAVINGRKVRKKVIPADIFNQAFAYDHLLPVQSIYIGTRRGGGKKKTQAKSAPAKPAAVKSAPGKSAVPAKAPGK